MSNFSPAVIVCFLLWLSKLGYQRNAAAVSSPEVEGIVSLQAEFMILLEYPPSACLQLLGTGAFYFSVETYYVSTHIFHDLIFHNIQSLFWSFAFSSSAN